MKPILGMGRSILFGVLIVLVSAAANLLKTPHAQDLPRPPAENRAKTMVREVLADPVFGGEKDVTGWRYFNTANTANTPAPPSSLQNLLEIVESLSEILRTLVWAGAVGLVAILIYLSYRYRYVWIGSASTRITPTFLFGLDVRPESLPDDVVSAALQELAKGNTTETLSLLYRATLASLIHRNQVDFYTGHTEDDCLRVARTAVDTRCWGYFSELLNAWKLTAYAGVAPPLPVLETLCHRWRSHFGPAAGSA